MIISIIF